MAYSQIGIINLALIRIGVKPIANIEEQSNASILAKAVWEYILDEVLEARSWKFAKLRVALAQNTTSPANTDVWEYAYDLPSDFIRTAESTKDDPTIYPDGTPYIIETIADGSRCLFTNYDNSSANLYLTYIRRIANPQKFSPAFINVLAWRLAAEFCLKLTEGAGKFEAMMNLYGRALTLAGGLDAALDYVEDETGSDSWETAGR